MSMKFRIIVTLGPSLLDGKRLPTIDALGECIYRINGAHSSELQARDYIARVRSILPQARILIDLPGNKVRTAHLEPPIRLIKGEDFSLRPHEVNYPGFHEHLKPGDMISAYDAVYTFEVLEAAKEAIRLRSHSDGLLHSNRGLHAKGVNDTMPFLFEKDYMLMRVAKEEKIDYLGLSFVRSGQDIKEVKAHLGPCDIHLIAKVETAAAIQNLYGIFQEVQSILIDRGDLSSAIGLLNIANAQRNIIDAAQRAHVEVYLATQFLKNMEQYPVPLIAEVIDLCQTVRSGIVGIQLSEETAVGKYPVECVKLVADAFQHSFHNA
ncbi:hypothetical protein HY477_03440 [Candidatus Uhrbacteria bacterium]|nr:hypothetical protein [Candidatus Uhrbacteria bacterium]